jgi:hypothetical protein
MPSTRKKTGNKKPPNADDVFSALRQILQKHKKNLVAKVDEPGNYALETQNPVFRGRPLWVAAVQTRKNYVSFHLVPVYMFPDLLKDLSPTLKKRMQGKGCFNFTTVDPALFEELDRLTEAGFRRARNARLP